MSPRSALLPLRLGLVAAGLAVAAIVPAQLPPPDPERAFHARNLAPLESWLERLPEQQRDASESLRVRAWLARRDGDVSRALSLIDRAIEGAPDRAALRLDRAAIRSDRIDDAGALRSLRIARDIRRDLEAAVELAAETERDRVRALTALITFHREAPGIAGGDDRRGEELMERLFELAPAHHRMQRALQAARNDDFETAIELARSAIESATGSVEPVALEWHLRLGRWLDRNRQPGAARAAYLEVLLRAPNHGPTLLALGRLAADTGERRELGIDALSRFVHLPRWPTDPPREEGWRQLALLYQAVDRPAEAQLARERAETSDERGRSAR